MPLDNGRRFGLCGRPWHPCLAPEELSDVTELLLAAHPALLHRDEIRREIGDADRVDEALAYLQRAGLVHVLHGFYWATRAATAAETAVTIHHVLGERE